MVRGLFVLARGGAVPSLAGRTASGFVVMIGVISLFADMTYEGARSVTGPFLAVLGASAAVAGPLLVAAILYAQGGYRWAFGTLLVPALLALAFLVAARLLYPQPRDFEPAETVRSEGGFPRIFWIYLASVAFLAAGYADFPLIAYHLKKVSVAADGSIPLLYALAMAVDAVAALEI